MFTKILWNSWFAKASKSARTLSRRPQSARLLVEQLEDRLTPSTLDLTTSGSIGTVNDAIYRQFDAQPTGSGVIDSFVRIQSNKGAVQQGYNTDHRSVQFNENTSPQFTRSLTVDALPVVNIGGVNYREFLLDINQKASQPFVSLDEVRIYVGNGGDLFGYDANTQTLAGMSAVYDLDAGGDNWIKLNARLNQGSGKGDMLMYIPDSLFVGGTHVYLYSKFGVNFAPSAGFEEWAAGGGLTCTTGSISGAVLNENSGAGVADILVFLDANHNGMLDSNETFTFTDMNGHYQFDFLATGLGAFSTYDVTFVGPDDEVNEVPPFSVDVSLQTCHETAIVNWFVNFGEPPPPTDPTDPPTS